MSFFGNLSNSEIAAILQIPVATVKTRIRDGLIKLRSTRASGPLGR
ncbi:DNA-directed RNA polymerase specialized sigma24 family protein [Nakamurella sp. UYEF19]